jgi:DNA-binding transcriptional LysR family regulator
MGTGLELRHLRAFVAVAEELHFTRAAARLHLAQQALSTQIRQLEEELGTPLFHRTTRRVELTDAGRTLLLHAGPILTSVSAAFEQTRRTASGELGTLSIAYTPTVAEETLPPLVAAVHARLPDVRVRTCEMWQAEMAEAVEAGRFDIGLARCPVLRDDLESAVLREEPLGIVLGAEHHLARAEVVRIEDIGAEKLLIWPRVLSPGFHDRVVDALRAHGFAGPVQEFENLTRDIVVGDAIGRGEVVAGRGFSIGFATQATRLPAGVVWRPLQPEPLIPVDMFWRAAATPVARSFVHLAREEAAAHGWIAGIDTGALSMAPGSLLEVAPQRP